MFFSCSAALVAAAFRVAVSSSHIMRTISRITKVYAS